MKAMRLLSACMFSALAALTGCVSPPDDARPVAAGLERRTGHTLTNGLPGQISWPSAVSIEEGLTEDEIVTLALWNNAAFLEVLADLGLSRADLIQAGMLPNPTLSALIPVDAKPFELTAKYPLEVLWLRPKRVAAAKLDYERTAQRLVQSGLDLIRDVRVAAADHSLANQRVELAGHMVTLQQHIAEQAEARRRAGEASELESDQARIDVLQAKEQFSRARQDASIANERLRHLAGLGFERWAPVQDQTNDAQLLTQADLLVTNALQARPDLRAAEIGLEAAGKRIGVARAEAFSLAAGLNGKDVGSGASKEFLIGPTVDLAVPVLNQNQGGVAQARARFEKAARQYYAARDRIALEVREAHARLTQAQQSIDQWQRQILPPLEASARQAESAYAAGNVTYLFVLEANRKLLDARARAATAATDVRRARAELERAIGQRLEIASSPAGAKHP